MFLNFEQFFFGFSTTVDTAEESSVTVAVTANWPWLLHQNLLEFAMVVTQFWRENLKNSLVFDNFVVLN